VAGRVLAGPMRKGEPLTDTRLVGPGLLSGYGPELVAVPVRIADAESVRLLHPGDRIDVLVGQVSVDGAVDGDAEASDRQVRAVVSSVPVIAIPRESSGDQSGPGDGALVVVAARRDQAAALSGLSPESRWSFVIVG
jgi:Flp pilus assembly protein CpaB